MDDPSMYADQERRRMELLIARAEGQVGQELWRVVDKRGTVLLAAASEGSNSRCRNDGTSWRPDGHHPARHPGLSINVIVLWQTGPAQLVPPRLVEPRRRSQHRSSDEIGAPDVRVLC